MTLREHAGCAFHVQAKGSLEPTYSDQTISALPVKRSTVEQYWLAQIYPVFLLMSDVRQEHTYYQKVSRDNYCPGSSETISFKIPLANRVTTESVGLLVEDILKSQPHMTPAQAIELAESFKAAHPYICHDLDHLQSLLEIMRGSDQHAQVEAKIAIKALTGQSGQHPQSLERGLLEIFRNCKDRITQSHVLDVLVAIESKAAISEVVKQIDRNTRLFEFVISDAYLRHRYISFLFHGMARLPRGNLKQEVKRLVRHPDPNVVNGAVWLCGQLQLAGISEDIFSLLKHPNFSIREQVAQTLSQLPGKAVTKKIQRIFDTSSLPEEIAASIMTLERTKQFENATKISALKSHTSPTVRNAVASFLGAECSGRFISDLLDLSLDEDACVFRQASRSFQMSRGANEIKEALLIPRIQQALLNDNHLELTLLLDLLRNNASERSMGLLIEMFRTASGDPKEYLVYDHEARLHQTVIVEIKSQTLAILAGFSVNDIYEDIANHIAVCHPYYVSVYLQVAAEKKIDAVFRVLTTLSDMMIEDIGSLYFSTICSIDSSAAAEWATSQLRNTKSAYVFSASIDLLDQMQLDCGTLTFLPSRIEELFAVPTNRELPFLYPLICRFEVLLCARQIADDLRVLMLRELPICPGYQMIETLAKVDFSEGHRALLEFLTVAEPHYRSAIIESLFRYRPEIALALVKQHSNDEDPQVRERCETMLAEQRLRQP